MKRRVGSEGKREEGFSNERVRANAECRLESKDKQAESANSPDEAPD
jgi:hypothetical protein